MEAFFSVENIVAAFLIFVRVGGLIMTAPFFSSSTFPVQIKIFFALVTSLMLFPVIPAESVQIPVDSGTLFLLSAIILESLVGIALVFVGQLIFA